MELVTFQSFDALKSLLKNGYLICDEKYIDIKKTGKVYDWVLEKMNKKVDNNTYAKYPIWCWVKCYNFICPPKRKGKRVEGFDIKITFNKKNEDVFITDFIKYSFLLNNMYIPDSKRDMKMFNDELKRYNITSDDLRAFIRKDKYNSHRTDKEYLSVCKRIRESFDKCITSDGKILQGCVWDIKLSEVEKIEILNKEDGYVYGSLNYIRSNGKRVDWIKEYYKTL